MAREVRILSQTYLPGGGFTTSGKPKQGKTMVVGQINVTSYTNGTGETFTANDMGLNNVDSVSFSVLQNGTTTANLADPTAGTIPGAQWRRSAGVVEVFDDASTETTNTEAALISFVAHGDSARDVETLA